MPQFAKALVFLFAATQVKELFQKVLESKGLTQLFLSPYFEKTDCLKSVEIGGIQFCIWNPGTNKSLLLALLEILINALYTIIV